MSEKPLKTTGRPSTVTSEVLSKLEQAYLLGCSDEEACLLAEISPSALYRYQQKKPEFRQRKRVLQKALSIKARKVIENDIESGDSLTARWYLERKEKQEFSAKADIDVTNRTDNVMTIEERAEMMAKILEQYK